MKEHSTDALKIVSAKFLISILSLFSLGLFAGNTVSLQVNEMIFRFFNNANEFIGLPLTFIMQLGSSWLIALIVLLLLIFRKKYYATLLTVAGLLSLIFSNLLKYIFEHQRPFIVLENVLTRTEIRDAIYAFPLESYGFPSGHTTAVAAIVSAIAPYLSKRQTVIGWVLVILVGMGRLYGGVHFPLDIVGGVLLGYAIGVLIRKDGLFEILYNRWKERRVE